MQLVEAADQNSMRRQTEPPRFISACNQAGAKDTCAINRKLKTSFSPLFPQVGDKGACALAAMLISEGAQSSLPLQALELEGNMVRNVVWLHFRMKK